MKQNLTDEKETLLASVEQKVNAFNFLEDVEVLDFYFKTPGTFDKTYYHLPQEFKLKNELLPYETVFPLARICKFSTTLVSADL